MGTDEISEYVIGRHQYGTLQSLLLRPAGTRDRGRFRRQCDLSGGITLQTLDTWKGFLNTQKVTLPNNGGELYFETEDMDAFLPQLDRWQVQFVHRLKEHRWGQRVVRFYDPDGHIIEVAEGLEQVAKRFLAQGMTPEQVAQRMDVPIQTLDLN